MGTKRYRPSNGTEGHCFMQEWCGTCAKDKVWSEGKDTEDCTDDELCSILGAVFAFEYDDPEYPEDWTYDKNGKPCCTAWISMGKPIPTRCKKTADMFGG